MSKLWLFLIMFVHINNNSLTQGTKVIVETGTLGLQSQYPFVVSIVPVLKSGPGVSCTGAILTDKWVITAAHCLNNDDVDWVSVRAAVMDSKGGSPNTQDRNSTHFVIHEGNPNGGKNRCDIALLNVFEPFNFDEYVRSITLAKKPLPTAKMTCVAIGYIGSITEAGQSRSSDLFSLPISAGDNHYCNSKNPNRVVAEEYVCLVPDYDNQEMHFIDSGGLLVCSGLLVGVLHGIENTDGEVVDNCVGDTCTQVYMHTGHFEPWIREKVPNIPAFQLLPGANLTLADPEYIKSGHLCLSCSEAKKMQSLNPEMALECMSDAGCDIMNDKKTKYHFPGYGDCLGPPCSLTTSAPATKATSAREGCRYTLIVMLLLEGVLFN